LNSEFAPNDLFDFLWLRVGESRPRIILDGDKMLTATFGHSQLLFWFSVLSKPFILIFLFQLQF